MNEVEIDAVEIVEVEGVEFAYRVGTHDREMLREIWEDRYYAVNGYDVPFSATVLDLGGGIGAYALYAARHGAAEVFTYEPMPSTYALLSRNVEASIDRDRVTTIQAAVTIESGKVFLSGFTTMDDGIINTGAPALGDTGIEVAGVSIHEVLGMRPYWDIVKLDIEGHEYPLFETFTPDEFAKIGAITMEFHHHDEATTLARGQELAALLEANGFTVLLDWSWGQQGRIQARRTA